MNQIASVVLAICVLVLMEPKPSEPRTTIEDKGDHLLQCSQEPIDFGIVLDSSSSINEDDFNKARQFLVNFLQQFEIGDGKHDVRVSIITFGLGIYPEDAFNLDTFTKKQEVLDAISEVRHRAGPYTDTGKGIAYMHEHQLSKDKVRPYADKIALVITDGNSQRWTLTRDEAEKARADNITMLALGVGSERQVGMTELVRIAGDQEHVTRVDNFDSLDAIKELLAKKTCIRKEKPTTPPPKMQSCGEMNPADIEFVFSPADMGPDATAWTANFINNVVDAEDMTTGFRYGATTGFCPDDEGFTLDAYDDVEDIKDHLAFYDEQKLPYLISSGLFEEKRGGRSKARDVAVLFVNGYKALKGEELEQAVQELVNNDVEVFIANPAGYPVTIAGTHALSGRSSRQQSENLINLLCPQ